MIKYTINNIYSNRHIFLLYLYNKIQNCDTFRESWRAVHVNLSYRQKEKRNSSKGKKYEPSLILWQQSGLVQKYTSQNQATHTRNLFKHLNTTSLTIKTNTRLILQFFNSRPLRPRPQQLIDILILIAID
jgi:hypothetical protein